MISIQDIQRLIKYFEEHIAKLQENPDSESYTFVTYGLNFQVQALAGDVRINPSNLLQTSPDDGEFTIVFMVNVGQSNVEACQTYVGGESVVTLKNIHSFTSLLQAVLTELGCSQ